MSQVRNKSRVRCTTVRTPAPSNTPPIDPVTSTVKHQIERRDKEGKVMKEGNTDQEKNTKSATNNFILFVSSLGMRKEHYNGSRSLFFSFTWEFQQFVSNIMVFYNNMVYL